MDKEKYKIKVAFDLDGTLYDTLPIILKTDNAVRVSMGYPEVSKEDYLENFQAKSWRKFYSDLGVRDEDIDEAIRRFNEMYLSADLPSLIPGAREAVAKTKEAVGLENIYVVTNESAEKVTLRFEKDTLGLHLSNVRNPSQDKASELYDLASLNGGCSFAYVGDVVSDGEACRDAIGAGASNLSFYGLLHPQAMNSPEAMIKFVEGNQDFARTLKSLDDVEAIWIP